MINEAPAKLSGEMKDIEAEEFQPTATFACSITRYS